MVNHLPNRPTAGAIRRGQLRVGQPRGERAHVCRRVFDRLQMCLARGAIERRGEPPKLPDRIAQRVQIAHSIDPYHGVESRREETFMAKRCITLIGVLILLASVSFNAAQDARPAAQEPRGGGGQPAAGGRAGAPPSIDDRTSGMRKSDGYFPLYW